MKKNNKKPLWVSLVLISILLIIGCYSFYAYVGNYYEANNSAGRALQNTDNVTVEFINKNDALAFKPKEAKAGIIFYSGAKVEYTAYAPLLHSLAENGILCIAPNLNFNLAIMDQNAADKFRKMYPEIKKWYMAGHSIGGVFAAKYAARHSDEFEGVILLAAYSSVDLSDTNLDVISIYGTEDKVLNMKAYKEGLVKLPKDYQEVIIDGGNHAYFGSYGPQTGDGHALITNDEQIESTVDNLIQLLQLY